MFLLTIPFLYFQKTRLNNLRSLLFHAYAEWVLGVAILYLSGYEPGASVVHFILGYLAFISVYEIGYILNDVHAVRYEEKPRKRLKDFNPSNGLTALWIGVRIAVFTGVTLYLRHTLRDWSDLQWAVGYAVLALMFYAHNNLKDKQLKTFTFMNLAFLRFLAPIFIFLTPEQTQLWIPAILLHYVFYRTLTYMDSKDLLRLPDRDTIGFKLNYYLLLSGISLTIWIFTDQPQTLWVNIYFGAFWLFFWLVQKTGLMGSAAGGEE